MKNTLSPVISLTKNGGKQLIKVMKGELKTKISQKEIKKNLTRGLSLRKNIKF